VGDLRGRECPLCSSCRIGGEVGILLEGGDRGGNPATGPCAAGKQPFQDLALGTAPT
jgi:hypothetical protein